MIENRQSEIRNPKLAFTLVELLVVITIIGILIALLLPAVQAAREAARRMQCSNNLKQTALATHLYVEQHGIFPAGVSVKNSSRNSATWVTWAGHIFPFLEQENLTALYNYSDDGSTSGYVINKTIFRTKIGAFCCPSDNADREGKYGILSVNDGGPGFTRSNVVACFRPDGYWIEPGAPQGGVSGTPAKRSLFNYNVAHVIAEIVDGTSNTAAFSEIISGPNDTGDARGEWWQDYGCHYEHLHNPNTAADTMLGASWASSLCDEAKVFCTRLGNWSDAHFAASSYHPGGVNVALADGSVRFANDTVNLGVWQALGSINGSGKDDNETSPLSGL